MTAPGDSLPTGSVGPSVPSQVLWGRTGLSNTEHTLVMSLAAGGRYIVVDSLTYVFFPSLSRHCCSFHNLVILFLTLLTPHRYHHHTHHSHYRAYHYRLMDSLPCHRHLHSHCWGLYCRCQCLREHQASLRSHRHYRLQDHRRRLPRRR